MKLELNHEGLPFVDTVPFNADGDWPYSFFLNGVPIQPEGRCLWFYKDLILWPSDIEDADHDEVNFEWILYDLKSRLDLVGFPETESSWRFSYMALTMLNRLIPSLTNLKMYFEKIPEFADVNLYEWGIKTCKGLLEMHEVAKQSDVVCWIAGGEYQRRVSEWYFKELKGKCFLPKASHIVREKRNCLSRCEQLENKLRVIALTEACPPELRSSLLAINGQVCEW